MNSFKRWAFLIVFAVGAILAGLFLGRKARPIQSISDELRSIKAEAEAEKTAARDGHEEAVRKIEARYADTIEDLSDRQKVQAVELRANPPKLARMLARQARG